MTNDDLDGYLDQLNAGTGPSVILHRMLSETVAVAHVWPADRGGGVITQSYRFFFFRGDESSFVGAIEDRGPSDLHVFVKPDYRLRGYLRRALMDIIFPWLAQVEGRKEQSLTFQDGKLKRAFTRRFGFRSTGELSARRSLRAFNKPAVLFLPKPPLDTASFKDMQARIRQARLLLEIVREGVELHGLGLPGTETHLTLDDAYDCLSRLDDNIRFDAQDYQKVRV